MNESLKSNEDQINKLISIQSENDGNIIITKKKKKSLKIKMKKTKKNWKKTKRKTKKTKKKHIQVKT